MQPSTPTRGATRVTVLPEAGRDEQLERWGLSSSAHWQGVDRVPRGGDDMAEVDAWGDASWDDPDQAARELEELGFIIEGGWTPAAIKNNRHHNGGLTFHRGVLHPGEYIDEATLQGMVERELGFTYEQVRSVYRQGPLSADQRELRGQIDARLLALSRAGGNMAELGRVLGFHVNASGACEALNNGLERARACEQVAA